MFNIVCGTYESSLHGYQARPNKESDENPLVLEQLFAYAPHTTSVKSVASSGVWLSSSSTDESLKIYDLKLCKEMGILTRTEGTVTCSTFFKDKFMLCGTEKGDILVWKCKEWVQMKSLEGHKDRINSISIHPLGTLMLSTSKDKTLKLWDLTNGTCVHTSKLEKEADIVLWSPGGNKYVLVLNNKINLYNQEGKKLSTLSKSLSRILSVTWLNEKALASGGDDKIITLWDTDSFQELYELTGYKNRIKGIAIADKEKTPEDDDPLPYLISISSDESIKIWDLNINIETPIVEERLDGFRLTCLTVSNVVNFVDDDDEGEEEKVSKKKRKRS